MRRTVAAVVIGLVLAAAVGTCDAAEPPQTLDGVFRDAFVWRTAGGEDELRLGAAAHLDARAFFADSVAPGGFDIRRARLDVQARLHGFATLRVQAAMEGSPYIRNAWLDLRCSPALHVRLGQMKVPFSTEWLSLDNNVNTVERATSTPLYPFFDRGVMVWGDLTGSRLTYQLGAFNGVGVDADAGRSDIDDHRDVAARLFWHAAGGPSDRSWEGLYLAVQGTAGSQSVPTRRFELGGLATPTYESRTWRWRTEQIIGTDGRHVDAVGGEIEDRRRWGVEAHWLAGPLAVSGEYLVVDYGPITVFHDYWVGSSRLLHEPVLVRDGPVRSAAVWGSWYFTGEHKTVDAFGWRQPDPASPWRPGGGGSGAWEIHARLGWTRTDDGLFDRVPVAGFEAGDLPRPDLPAVGGDGAVAAAVVDGAPTLWEATVGAGWTLDHNVRFLLDVTWIEAPDLESGRGGIVSGAGSDLADPGRRNQQVASEASVVLRCVFRI